MRRKFFRRDHVWICFDFLYVLNGILMKIGPKGNQEGLPGDGVYAPLFPMKIYSCSLVPQK